jgi:hypothetical protein
MQCRGFRSDVNIAFREDSLTVVNSALFKNLISSLKTSASRALGRRFAMSHLVSTLHDAAVSPEAWPQVLEALMDAAGVAGAALIIFNKSTGNVDEAYCSGLSAGFKSDYVRHYAALDPYSPLLDGSWKKLSECLPDQVLRENEWYNDFVVIALSSVFTSRSVAASPTESIRL